MLRDDLRNDGLAGDRLEQAVAERSRELLGHMIDRALLMQIAKEAGLSAEVELVRMMEDLRVSRKLATMEDLEKLIIEQVGDLEEFKNDYRTKFLTERVIDHEVVGRIVITNEEMREFYEANKEKFDRPKGIRLGVIAVLIDRKSPEQMAEKRKKLEEALAAVKKGENFEETATKYSEIDSAGNGGDLGFFGEGDLNEDTQKAVGSLAKGEVTGILEATDVLAFYKVTDKHDGGILSFSLAQPMIGQELMNKVAPPKIREYLTRLRKDGFVEVKEGFVDTGAQPEKTNP
jgi:peptidyl-prolyl cis-trans isomerase SurA